MINLKDPNVKLDKNGLPKIKPLTDAQKKKFEEWDKEAAKPVRPDGIAKDPALREARGLYVDNGLYVQSSVHYNDADYVPKVRNELIQEFNATNKAELLLVDMVTNAYFGYMRSSKALMLFIEDNDGRRDFDSQTWINMMKELGKIVDMANRHFTTSLTCLKEFRQQPVKVKVHAKEAFIANNQQFNKNA
ncbi:hypothetical protein M1563_00885 [Patescibacteria group bacterium]|nr:hypothetical protein [Patescibacteria group bacterium]